MTWTLAQPGLPPASTGHVRPADDPASHRKAVRWIGRKVPGSIDRGRAARRRWAGVSDDLLSDARREIAGAIRAVDEVPDQVANRFEIGPS